MALFKPRMLGLNRTGHMSVQPGQDRTPNFAGRVLPDRTESGPLFFPITYHLHTNFASKVLNCVVFENYLFIFRLTEFL